MINLRALLLFVLFPFAAIAGFADQPFDPGTTLEVGTPFSRDYNCVKTSGTGLSTATLNGSCDNMPPGLTCSNIGNATTATTGRVRLSGTPSTAGSYSGSIPMQCRLVSGSSVTEGPIARTQFTYFVIEEPVVPPVFVFSPVDGSTITATVADFINVPVSCTADGGAPDSLVHSGGCFSGQLGCDDDQITGLLSESGEFTLGGFYTCSKDGFTAVLSTLNLSVAPYIAPPYDPTSGMTTLFNTLDISHATASLVVIVLGLVSISMIGWAYVILRRRISPSPVRSSGPTVRGRSHDAQF